MFFGWKVTIFCSLLLCDVARTSTGTNRQLSGSVIKPGFPISVKTNDPGVRKAARFGVYRYNNSSNDIFLFKESHINKATLQVVKGLKYRLDVDIRRTVCSKRMHPDLDRCDFQRNETLRKTFRCYFEVLLMPWLQRIQVPVSLCS
ncbi:cystatin-F [Elgaria multicarinata webbii]|uniref:cystatin-F n=1 Tax=Elgaria multicarinata webbii TaxID=159646 RepID=UPI002FCCBCB3